MWTQTSISCSRMSRLFIWMAYDARVCIVTHMHSNHWLTHQHTRTNKQITLLLDAVTQVCVRNDDHGTFWLDQPLVLFSTALIWSEVFHAAAFRRPFSQCSILLKYRKYRPRWSEQFIINCHVWRYFVVQWKLIRKSNVLLFIMRWSECFRTWLCWVSMSNIRMISFVVL